MGKAKVTAQSNASSTNAFQGYADTPTLIWLYGVKNQCHTAFMKQANAQDVAWNIAHLVADNGKLNRCKLTVALEENMPTTPDKCVSAW